MLVAEWLEELVYDQEDLGSIPATFKILSWGPVALKILSIKTHRTKQGKKEVITSLAVSIGLGRLP